MRDGIFKRMPQSRQWRGMWQSCNRAAEREGIARFKAERALLGDLKKELRSKFTTNFLDRCFQTETSLPLPGVRFFGENVPSRDLGGENSPLEQSTLRHARRLEEAGLRGADLAAQSLACAHKEWADRQMRQMTQFCIDEAGYTDRPTISAARAAIAAQDYVALAKSYLGTGPKRSGKATPLNLDEDISRPH